LDAPRAPDQELFDLAAKKQLHKNLPAQVKRMLADPKSAALVENFAAQWLKLRSLSKFEVDTRVFPEFETKISLEKNDLRFRTLVTAIVQSDAFRMVRGT